MGHSTGSTAVRGRGRRSRPLAVAAVGVVLLSAIVAGRTPAGATTVTFDTAVVAVGDGTSMPLAQSANGRWVVFESTSTNLVPGVSSGGRNAYVWDRDTRTTIAITNGPADTSVADVSNNARFVLLISASDLTCKCSAVGPSRLYLWDRVKKTTILVPTGATAGTVLDPTAGMSDDGRYVVYSTTADVLQTGVEYTHRNLYTWDSLTKVTTAITNDPDRNSWLTPFNASTMAPTADQRLALATVVSTTGRFVIFNSASTKLVPGVDTAINVFLWDRTTRSVRAITDISCAAPHPHNRTAGCVIDYLRDPYPMSMSEDGKWVVFEAAAVDVIPGVTTDGFYNVYLWSSATGQTRALTNANAETYHAKITPNGRYVIFDTNATNIVPGVDSGTSNSYLYDRVTGTTVAVNGGDHNVGYSFVTPDGRWVLYASDGQDLVPGGTHGDANTFLWDRSSGLTTAVTNANGTSFPLGITDAATHVLLLSNSTDLVAGVGSGSFAPYQAHRTEG